MPRWFSSDCSLTILETRGDAPSPDDIYGHPDLPTEPIELDLLRVTTVFLVRPLEHLFLPILEYPGPPFACPEDLDGARVSFGVGTARMNPIDVMARPRAAAAGGLLCWGLADTPLRRTTAPTTAKTHTRWTLISRGVGYPCPHPGVGQKTNVPPSCPARCSLSKALVLKVRGQRSHFAR